MAKYRIVTICGSGIASSTIAGQKILKGLAKRGLDVEVKAISMREAGGEIAHVDLFVTIAPGFKAPNLAAPVVNGVAFLTGVGEEKVLDEIADRLKKLNK